MTESFVAIICGSRTLTNDKLLRKIDDLCVEMGYDIVEVVSGGAKGADKLGEVWASYYDIDLTIMPANWALHGKAAGSIRNRRMLNYLLKHPDNFTPLVIALWDGESRGTKCMIDIATSAGIRVEVIKL